MSGVGLALSGGGFRATLFHLGVVRRLREKNLLSDVSHICSVSGGSITAAHLVLNWDRYTGDLAEFESAADELIAFTQTDLRGAVMRPWMFSFASLGIPRMLAPRKWTRTSLCQSRYRRLFKGAQLNDLRRFEDAPELHLLSTSMTTGDLVSFNAQGIHIENDKRLQRIDNSKTRSDVVCRQFVDLGYFSTMPRELWIIESRL
jgi:predicted acylesterase/phospholipase RssA